MPNAQYHKIDSSTVESSELSIAVNNTICTLAQKAYGEIEVLGNNPLPTDSKRVIGSLISSYHHLMETHYDCFSETNIVTMLHKIAGLSHKVGQGGWAIRQYNEFMTKLLYYVIFN